MASNRVGEAVLPMPMPRGRMSGIHRRVIPHEGPERDGSVSDKHPIVRAPGFFLLDILARIEATAHTRAHIFSCGEDCLLGEVISSNGQVCMVSRTSGETPLAARLRAKDPAVAEAIRDALARARIDGRSLRGALSALGPGPGEIVRSALHDQFVEGLLAFSGFAAQGLVETVHTSPRQLPTILTAFSALDMYWAAASSLAPTATDAAKACYEELGNDAERAALVAFSPGPDALSMLVGTRGFAPSSMAEVVKLGTFVERTLRPRALIAMGEEPAVLSLGRGKDLVVGVVGSSHMAMFVGARPDLRARAVAKVQLLASA